MDAIEAKYLRLEEPGIRAFMIEGERPYPPDAVNFSLEEQRDFYNRYCAHFRKSRPEGVAARDFRVGKIPCRRYLPKGKGTAILLCLHGGGFVVGGLESHDDSSAYAEKLRACGVAAEVRDEPLLVHAFLRTRHMTAPAARSFSAIVDAIRRFSTP